MISEHANHGLLPMMKILNTRAAFLISLLIVAGCSSLHGSDPSSDGNLGSVTGKTSPANKPQPAKPVTTTATAPAATTNVIQRSISDFVACDGVKDDNANVARALAAAKNSAFTLIIDCPVRIDYGKNGMDIERTLFIDNGTTVQFAGAG
jgi:hypothetical protein